MDAITEREIREVLTKEMDHGVFHCNMRSIIVERIMKGIKEALDRNLSRQLKELGGPTISADPRGSERAVRVIPTPQRPPDEFNPLGGASRGVGRCTCAAGPGTNPSCPVHP